MPVRNAWGEDYNKALCGARVALCFLSRLNRDTYTRRSFEIPASGTLMLAQYTEDLAGMFKPGEDADFFRSPEELVQKLQRYLGDDALRRRVALAGQRRVATDGHDVVSRMRQLAQWIAELKEARRAA
jgi:spore maturation protein CgeB